MEAMVTKVLFDILIAIGSLLGAYITIYFKKRQIKLDSEIAKIDDEKTKSLINTALERLGDLVTKGVYSAQQTLVGDIKNQIALGTANKSDLEKIGKDVANTVYGQLSTDAINTLQTEINDVKQYIVDSVEARLLKLKIDTAIINTTITTPALLNVENIKLPNMADTKATDFVAGITQFANTNVSADTITAGTLKVEDIKADDIKVPETTPEAIKIPIEE